MNLKYNVENLDKYIIEINEKNKTNKKIPVFTVSNTLGFVESREYFDKRVYSKNLSNYKIVKKGYLAYNPSRINVGSIALFKNEIGLVSPLYVVFKTSSELDEKYLLYFLKSDYGLVFIKHFSQGSVRDSLKFQALKHIKIPVPTLEIQKQIVVILERAERLKEMREKTNEETNEIIQSIFYEMFGDPIKNERKFKVEKLGDFVKFDMGGTPNPRNSEYYGGNIKWLKGSDIEKEFIYDVPNRITEEGLNNSNAKIYDAGTVVVGRTGQGKTRGKVAILRVKAATNETMIAIMSDKNILSPEYLQQNLKLRYKELRHFGGQNQRGGITQHYLKKLSITIPPIELQSKFVSIVKKFELLKEKQKQSTEEINQLFDALMQKTFKGELVN